MMNQLKERGHELINAAIYVDYENICELLRKYGVNPLEIGFFPVILDKIKHEYRLNIVECVVYGNFNQNTFLGKQKMVLHKLGLKTRHSSNDGKNCSDLMLTVDTLTTLYKNPNINAFVIVFSNRDMVPVIGAIKYENKLAYMLTTKYGFNPNVCYYPDHHEYIEDIFHLTQNQLTAETTGELELTGGEPLDSDAIENAIEVSQLFYHSNVWRTYIEAGDPVTLKGYINIISKKICRDAFQIMQDFKLAHHFKYITIYEDQMKGLCLSKGENYSEVAAAKKSAV